MKGVVQAMTRKIILTDIKGKAHEKEFNVRNEGLLVARQMNRASTFKNKKAYTRKEKHKNNFENY